LLTALLKKFAAELKSGGNPALWHEEHGPAAVVAKIGITSLARL
jgi:hypothetical protein